MSFSNCVVVELIGYVDDDDDDDDVLIELVCIEVDREGF